MLKSSSGGKLFAKWKDRLDKTRTATLTTANDGCPRLSLKLAYFVAPYRDKAGVVRTVSTGGVGHFPEVLLPGETI
jgi:hypothetical protein